MTRLINLTRTFVSFNPPLTALVFIAVLKLISRLYPKNILEERKKITRLEWDYIKKHRQNVTAFILIFSSNFQTFQDLYVR